MRLYVLSNYVNRDLKFQQGDVIDNATPELVKFLLNDAPGCFSKTKELTEPPKNKMVGAPDYSKATVVILRNELRSRGLPVVGTKPELIERLENA